MAKQLGSLHTMHKVSLGAYPMARCLDGSPGAFYIAPAKKKANAMKWFIHFPSSGVCSMSAPRHQTGDCVFVEHCADRSRGPRGSSASYPVMTPLLESEQMTVPLARDWNRIVVVSCDGGMFSGRVDQPVTVDGTTLYFRGGYIVDAIIDTLIRKFGLAEATDVLISGTGAGGAAAGLHADRWRHALPTSVFVAVVSDSGMSGGVMTSASQDENPVAALHRANFHDMNVSDSLHPDCVTERTSAGAEEADCFFGDFAVRFSRTPMFVKQSATEYGDVHCAPKQMPNTSEARLLDGYATHLRRAVQHASRNQTQHGFYVDNCLHQEGKWFASRINGMSATEAFNSWYTQRQKAYVAGEKASPSQAMVWEQSQPCKINSDESEHSGALKVSAQGSDTSMKD